MSGLDVLRPDELAACAVVAARMREDGCVLVLDVDDGRFGPAALGFAHIFLRRSPALFIGHQRVFHHELVYAELLPRLAAVRERGQQPLIAAAVARAPVRRLLERVAPRDVRELDRIDDDLAFVALVDSGALISRIEPSFVARVTSETEG